MKDLKLAYVLNAQDMQDLEECIRLLTHADSNFTRPSINNGAIERLNLLSLRLRACPELRAEPLVPRIPNVEPLTAGEINELNRFSDILHVYLTIPLRRANPDDEEDPCSWGKAHWRIEHVTPLDLSLYIATLRRLLQYTDCQPDRYEAINLYLGVRVPDDGKSHSDPAGWLENQLLFKDKAPSKHSFTLGCLQRTISATPEFHS